MSDIFVSYRRQDSSTIVGRLVDRLEARFGKAHIFRDIESIEFGEPFDEAILKTLAVCKVVLVIIGKRWIDIKDNKGVRRLDKQDDWVRIEVAKSLEKGVYVIPVLVEGAVMPSADELPEDLKSLASRNAAKVRDDPDFDNDVERLFSVITNKHLSAQRKPDKKKTNKLVIVGALLTTLLIAVLIYVFQQHSDEKQHVAGPFWADEGAHDKEKCDNGKVRVYHVRCEFPDGTPSGECHVMKRRKFLGRDMASDPKRLEDTVWTSGAWTEVKLTCN